MLKNYLIIAWRNFFKNPSSSWINVGGLAVGMAVALLIGLWIQDEYSYDIYNRNYDRIALVMQNQHLNDNIVTWDHVPYPVAKTLRDRYSQDFRHVTVCSWSSPVITAGDKKIVRAGMYMDPEATIMLDLRTEAGRLSGLNDPASVLLSSSLAKAFFPNTDPIGQIIKIDTVSVKVMGVYQDLPHNSQFANAAFIASWQQLYNNNQWLQGLSKDDPWGNNGFQVYVQLAPQADLATISQKIKDVKLNNIRRDQVLAKPALFLHPMSRWHLYGDFGNGVNTGGRIQFVWLFSIIGVFVLLLACINFMNLSTARSERRAREVGIRKAIGSLRSQLIRQFFCESILVATLAFLLCLLLIQGLLPLFNQLAGKEVTIPWSHPLFWSIGLGCMLVTGLIAGSYPALYLSSFRPVKVLKGSFKAGRLAALPRRALVVLQFTVSLMLVIGTIIVYRQVQVARNRPLGYNRNGLLSLEMYNRDLYGHFDAIRRELQQTGAITDLAVSSSPVTRITNSNGGMSWRGKPAGISIDFPLMNVTFDFGKTIDWQLIAGRDFSRDFATTDSSAFVINEAAARLLGFKNPVGEDLTYNDGVSFKIIGVVKDFVIESPYAAVRPTLFRLERNGGRIINIRLNPQAAPQQALATIAGVLKKYSPALPFDYHFVDDDYAKKYADEANTGHLATVFAILAIFISCLGMFGLASFFAEQRTREIGVRKVLGASVFTVWRLLSTDFVLLVVLAGCLAIPLAWYGMHRWLQQYTYRATLSWWIFATAGLGVLVLALLTVSVQTIRAAVANPVKALRAE